MQSTENQSGPCRYKIKVARPDGNGLLQILQVNDREYAKKMARLLARHLHTHTVAVDTATGGHYLGRYGNWMSEDHAREILGNIGRPSAAVAFTRLYMDLRGGQA